MVVVGGSLLLVEDSLLLAEDSLPLAEGALDCSHRPDYIRSLGCYSLLNREF